MVYNRKIRLLTEKTSAIPHSMTHFFKIMEIFSAIYIKQIKTGDHTGLVLIRQSVHQNWQHTCIANHLSITKGASWLS